MADQEIIKHTKKVHRIITNKKHNLIEKIKEISLEIFIIVFAVSLSIWLHGWSEHQHDQQDVKKFLIGLKSDIQNDINSTKSLIKQYQEFGQIYQHLNQLDQNKSYDENQFKKELSFINLNAYLRPNIYRFNGFVSSGRIGNIENDSLSLNILRFYQKNLSEVNSSESGWLARQKKLQSYLEDNLTNPESTADNWKLLNTPKGKQLTKNLVPWDQIYERYNNLILLGETIVKQIDKEYDIKE
ncbi:DUF6090 family protein [Flavobacterium sp. Fl-318]|uniref:DUF6090 family protein n=1 Tax=Flavobacterium cupriresistens TaxID=2893885 RepID=A0ABU4RDN7_9FLAO|nr:MULTISPECIES: DUF6090 family protein [unclassified Flavobacterium]MDX6189565.1 DUF6090 family protein [Flavobacterium sp. Fl-318]UFH41027.1 DUF6090 family protein [Flavobacterium sp. F-323]